MMPFELFVALRYLKSKRKVGFISIISVISVAGVAIGVAALIIVLSVMNGFESEVRSRFIGINTHVKVRAFHHHGMETKEAVMHQLEGIPHIIAMSPYIDNQGLILSKEKTTGIIIRGIEAETAVNVSDILDNIVYGELELGPVQPEEEGEKPYPGIVLGFSLADRLMVTIGDRVTVASFVGVRNFLQPPYMMPFRVAGYFESGIFDIDANMAFISIESAQKLFQMDNKISGIELKLDNYRRSEAVADTIRAKLGFPYTAETWFDLNQTLFTWMKLERWAAFVVLCLIIMVAAFNIVSTMIMVTMEKIKDIGILKSMGATSQSVRKIFTFEGLFVGISGTIMGCIIGYVLCWAQQTYKFFALPGDVYIIDWLPVLMRWQDFIMISAASIFITYIAAIYPAIKAAKNDPVEIIRNE
ncbi:ABC transporter permease [candidate division KSB1 bacterium]|nr:ABC transporter permease [candidate division KSB1 bacterium]